MGESGVATRGGGRSWGTRRKRKEGGGSAVADDCTAGARRDEDRTFFNVAESGCVIGMSGEYSLVGSQGRVDVP